MALLAGPWRVLAPPPATAEAEPSPNRPYRFRNESEVAAREACDEALWGDRVVFPFLGGCCGCDSWAVVSQVWDGLCACACGEDALCGWCWVLSWLGPVAERGVMGVLAWWDWGDWDGVGEGRVGSLRLSVWGRFLGESWAQWGGKEGGAGK